LMYARNIGCNTHVANRLIFVCESILISGNVLNYYDIE
jgi:hypothetical protein